MRALLRLAAAFPQPEVHPATVAVYAEKLAGEQEAHVEAACDHAMRTSAHFPRIADLLGFIRTIKVRDRAEEDRRRMLSEGQAWERAALDDGASDIPRGFRYPTGCSTLIGETWRVDELNDAQGQRRMENNIFYRAKQAAAKLE